MILDLTKPEGAKVINEELFLYQYVKYVNAKADEFLSYNDSEDNVTNEFFSTNIFINGKRGTGKTSVLLTVYNELKINDRYKKSLEVLPIIDISTNVQSILIYLLSHLKRYYNEEIETETCCEEKLYELLYKLEVNFPILLKCICSSSCEVICREELHILLERNEISFIEELTKFITLFLKKIGKKKLVILIDDFDIPYDPKTLVRLLVELGVFLNHKDIIIIGAGDISNLYTRLKELLKEQMKLDENKYNLENLAQSYIEKVFPLRNIITLKLIDVYFIANNVKIRWNNDGNQDSNNGKLEDFLKRHPSLKKIIETGYKDSLYAILDKQSVRTFVQTLKSIDERIRKIEEYVNNNQSVFLKDILLSGVFISLALNEKHYIDILETNINLKVEIRKKSSGIVINIFDDNLTDDELKNLQDEAWKAFKSFNEFLNNLFSDDFNYFTWRNLTEFRDYRFRFLDSVKRYNIKLYGALYIWLTEIFFYLGRYTVPLFLIVWSIIYGLPIILFKLFGTYKEDQKGQKSEEEIKPFSAKDYLSFVVLDSLTEFDYSLNLIDYELRRAKVYEDYKNFILFGKVFRYRVGGALHLHFYRFLLSAFVSLFYSNLEDFTEREKYELIIDNFSYEYDMEMEEEKVQKPETQSSIDHFNFQEILEIYKWKLEYLKELQDILKSFVEFAPSNFDRVIFNLTLTSKDLIFRKPKNIKVMIFTKEYSLLYSNSLSL